MNRTCNLFLVFPTGTMRRITKILNLFVVEVALVSIDSLQVGVQSSTRTKVLNATGLRLRLNSGHCIISGGESQTQQCSRSCAGAIWYVMLNHFGVRLAHSWKTRYLFNKNRRLHNKLWPVVGAGSTVCSEKICQSQGLVHCLKLLCPTHSRIYEFDMRTHLLSHKEALEQRPCIGSTHIMICPT